MKNRMLLIAILVVALLTAAGCIDGSSAPDEPEARTIAVETHDIYFGKENDNVENPPVWAVPSGAEVKVNLANLGNLEHDWAIVKADAELPQTITAETDLSPLLLFDAGKMESGSEKTVTFTAPSEPGDYLVICTVPGHYPTMQGRLEVK